LDLGLKNQELVRLCPKKGQTTLFSATMTEEIERAVINCDGDLDKAAEILREFSSHTAQQCLRRERETQVFITKLSEQAERYEEMVECMKAIAKLNLEPTVATVFLFFLLSFLSSCSCPTTSDISASNARSASIGVFQSNSGNVPLLVKKQSGSIIASLSTRKEDVKWVKDQIRMDGLHMQDNVFRKGINPRTRTQQLEDLGQFKGISHYEKPGSDNHTAFASHASLSLETEPACVAFKAADCLHKP